MSTINKVLLAIIFSFGLSYSGLFSVPGGSREENGLQTEVSGNDSDGAGLEENTERRSTDGEGRSSRDTSRISAETDAAKNMQFITMTSEQFNSLLQTINRTMPNDGVLKVEIKNKSTSFWQKTWEKSKNFFKKLLFLKRAVGIICLVYSGGNIAAYYNIVRHPEYLRHALMGIKAATVIFVSAEFFETVKDLFNERQKSIWNFIKNSTVIVFGSVIANGVIYKLMS
ncbi:MAG: hypothetical protein WC436_02995 [Candidatus Babeliales bacterium]